MPTSTLRLPSCVDGLDKGAPALAGPLALDAVGAAGWNVLGGDLPLPVAIVRDAALRGNSGWMRSFLARTGARIAPHGKTSMAPELFRLQLDDGAWAITLSTPHQVRVARAHGIGRIFLANQLVGPAAVGYVLDELARDPAFDFYCLVDSVELVDQLDAQCERHSPAASLKVLVELGFADGRTGCRDDAEALAVARRVHASRHLKLCGVEGFEGIIRADTQDQRASKVCDFLDRIVDVAERCAVLGLFEAAEVLLTAGGTSFFDLVVERLGSARLPMPTAVVTRSGCYLTLDSHMFRAAIERMKLRSPAAMEGLGELRPALEVWAYVQSRPEPTIAIVALGKRDISYDDLPVPLYAFRPGRSAPDPIDGAFATYRIDDQHCYVRVPADAAVGVGDLIGFGISHPCLTFDKWRLIYRVDESYGVIGAFRTFF